MSRTAQRLVHLARRRAGMSQAELARRAGMSRSIVNAYERGTRDPGVAALAKLLRAAGMDLALSERPPLDEARSARELADALQLAAALPQPPRRPLRYPRFATLR
jgi:transcriptional regulator with XRE-family HTH domain